MLLEIIDSFSRYGLLDRQQDIRNRILGSLGTNEKVNVVRHKHVSPEIKAMFVASGVNCVNKKVAGLIFSQEWLITITAECKFVSVACDIHTMTTLCISTFG